MRNAGPPSRIPLGLADRRSLRIEAERRFAANAAQDAELSPEESRGLLRELGIRRIELELEVEELRRTVDDLEFSQERYFDLYDVAPVGYATVTRKGTILEANLTLAKWLGVDRSTLVGIPLSRFIDRASVDAYMSHLRQLFETEVPSSIEVGMVREGGETLWARIDTVVHHDESSGSKSCRLALSDVTRRKQVQDTLRQSEEKYRQIVETTHEGIWMIDAAHRTTFVNRRMAEMLGYSPEEMLGQHIFAFMSEESRAEAERRLAGGREKVTETRERLYRAKDGSDVWGLLTVNPLYAPDGTYAGALAMVADITARKRAERELQALLEVLDERVAEKTAELREATAYNRSLIEASLDPLVTIDREGRISDVNEATVRATGVPRDQLVRSDFSDYFTDPGKARAGYARVFRDGIVRDYELQIRRRDGSRLPVEYNAAVYRDSDGEVAGVFAAARDITERKQADLFREIGRKILEIFAEPGDLRDSIRRVVEALKSLAGFDAVGIRLQVGEDFPYFVQEGFSDQFLSTENTLVERGVDGGVCRDQEGRPLLECTCGLVLSGRTDPANPLFTPGGSCWTNDSLPLLDLPPGDDPRYRPRNRCVHQGYLSVALVPIRSGGRIVGLIQLNDGHKGRFTLRAVELLEEAATFIGAALMRRAAEEELRSLRAGVEQRVKERTAELARSRELLEETARLSRAGGWEVDLRTNVLTWTDVTYEIHEVEPGRRMTVEDGFGFYAPESRARITELFRRAAAAGEPFDEEMELLTARGRRVRVRAIGKACLENGRIARVGGVLQEVTPRELRTAAPG